MIRTFYLLAAIVIALLLTTLTLLAQAVVVVPGDRFSWPMAGSLPLIQSYRYEVEVDGRILPTALINVTCALEGEALDCTAPIPVIVGQHVLRVRAIDVSIPGVASAPGAWSPLWPYVMTPAQPPTPGRPRSVKPKGEV
jgi:hypothetical protein